MPPFELSIVVAAQGKPEETANCLRSLLGQTAGEQVEIIVAEAPPCSAREFWWQSGGPETVKFLQSQSGHSLPSLHSTGMAAATAPLVAITEGHCTFAPDWAAVAIAAHNSRPDTAVIGGSVLPGEQLGPLNTALFLCDYAQFLPPLERAETADLPGNNIVFKRQFLPDLAQLAADGFWKTFFCKQLEKEQKKLEIDPAMVVYYNRQLTARQIMTRRYHHGRCFGGMRASMISAGKRVVICFTGAALPALLSWKLSARCRGKGDYYGQLISLFPAALLCMCTWAAGEWIGNLIGPGHSCELL